MFKKGTSDTEPTSVGKIKLILLLAGAALGILLLILGNNGFSAGDKASEESPVGISEQEEVEAYRTALEERIRRLCESVNGVKQVTVAVSLSGNYEEVYAVEENEDGESYVIIGSGSNASALHLSRLSPEISGIGIVCCGGGNADVHRELISLVSAAFHVPSNRIYVAEAKSE